MILLIRVSPSFLSKVESITSMINEVQLEKYDNQKKEYLKNHFYMRGHDLELFFDLMIDLLQINTQLSKLLKDEALISDINVQLNLR